MRRQDPIPDGTPEAVRQFVKGLRDLQQEAGLSLRQLAQKSTYSESSFSRATSGKTFPRLDVTQAYVSACTNALLQRLARSQQPNKEAFARIKTLNAQWTKRWHQVANTPGVPEWDAKSREQSSKSSQDQASEPDPDPSDSSNRSRIRRLGAFIASTILLLGTVIGAVTAVADAFNEAHVANQCPESISPAAFTARTRSSGANLRTGARLDATLVTWLPADCTLYFSGFCIGDEVMDGKAGAPDIRWFIMADGSGVVASAVVSGSPPKALAPTSCAGGLPAPSEVTMLEPLTDNPSGEITLRATAPRAPIVGFVREYIDPSDPQLQAWIPIGRTTAREDFSISWKWEGAIPRGQGEQRMRIAAVVCLAALAPTDLIDGRALTRLGDSLDRVESTPVTLDPISMQSALEAACR